MNSNISFKRKGIKTMKRRGRPPKAREVEKSEKSIGTKA